MLKMWSRWKRNNGECSTLEHWMWPRGFEDNNKCYELRVEDVVEIEWLDLTGQLKETRKETIVEVQPGTTQCDQPGQEHCFYIVVN